MSVDRGNVDSNLETLFLRIAKHRMSYEFYKTKLLATSKP